MDSDKNAQVFLSLSAFVALPLFLSEFLYFDPF